MFCPSLELALDLLKNNTQKPVAMSETIQLSQIGPQLGQLRLKNSFVDLNIIGNDGTRVCAHKVVLAARWPNLESILKNTRNRELSWTKYPSSIIEAAVNFAYTGKIQLDIKNVMRVYLLALSVQSAELEKLCIDFFLPRITRSNLEHTWSIALGTGSASLKCGCINVMRTHFEGLVGSCMFLKLDLETLKFILNNFDFPGRPEESKLKAITTWINKKTDRLEYLPELSTFIFQNKHTATNSLDIFLVVEDKESQDEHLRIVQLDPEKGEVTSVGHIPYLESPSIAVVCAGSIFCLGDFNCTGRVHMFDPIKRAAWTPTRLVEPVRLTAATASSYELIVSGGVNDSGQTVATSGAYTPATKSWTSLPQLRHARHSHRMCWLPDGGVFAIGGYHVGHFLSSVEMLERAWIPSHREEASVERKHVSPMKKRRCDFGCCVVEGRILVAGGRTDDCDNRSLSVESFKPPTATKTGQWTSVTNLAYAVSVCFLVPSAAGLVLIHQDGSGMQLGRREAQDQPWIWEPRPGLTSFENCYGLASLPSTSASTRWKSAWNVLIYLNCCK